MNPHIHQQRCRIEQLEQELKREKDALTRVERDCRHEWDVIPDHIYHASYMTRGDPPGTMGIDWRGPCHVPARTEERWKRTCKVCGKVEITNRAETQTHTTRTPKF